MIHLSALLLVAGATQQPPNPLNIPEPTAEEVRRCAPPGVTDETPISAIPRDQLLAGIACLQALNARLINSVVPAALDELTTLVSASSSGAMLQYNYRVNVDADQVTAAARDAMATATRNSSCGMADIRGSVRLGGSYRYAWMDRQGRPLHALLIESCP